MVACYFDILVIASLLGLCLQTIPTLRGHKLAWFLLESIISGQFLMRLLLKLSCCPSLVSYVWSLEFGFDLLGIAPWPVELMLFLKPVNWTYMTGLRFLRVLRFGRLFQCWCFRVPEMRLFSRALRRSRPAFLFLFGYGSMALLCFAWIIFLVETAGCRVLGGRLVKGKGEGDCPLQNMFDSIWLCLCTVFTVGYGDRVPQKPLAKVLTSIMMVGSYVMLPLPIAIFGANLTELYVEARLKRRHRKHTKHENDFIITESESEYNHDAY